MEAHFIDDWGKEFEEYQSTAPPLPPWTIEAATEATEDAKEVAWQLKKMPKRRAAPSWSLPLELFGMIMRPGKPEENRRAGIGTVVVESSNE
eukprot:5477231-Heterocapsa_arctica.AAC.1